MKKLITLFIIAMSVQTQGQQFCTDLYGFKLGQYRKAAKTELGKPIKYEKFEDGFVYEAFLLKPDTSLYVIFEYASTDTNVIWSIQVTGNNKNIDIGFKNARMGIDKLKTEKLFGKPSSIENIGEYGQKWIYDKTNFSLEVNTDGFLSSIKILDNSQELFPAGPDLKKIPTFEKIRSTLNSINNSDILNLLCGDMEIYYEDKVYSFEKSFGTEQISDYSKMITLIRKISKDLSTVNTTDDKEYGESMRIALGEDTKHVIKIKKDHTIKEIVLKYYGGQYLIYEINADL